MESDNVAAQIVGFCIIMFVGVYVLAFIVAIVEVCSKALWGSVKRWGR